MKLEFNTNLIPLFSGTYNTIWVIEEVDDEGNEMCVEYSHEDFMKSIIEAYQAHEKTIVNELGVPFVKSIQFIETYSSPHFYNFSTDELDFTLEIDEGMMKEKLKELSSDLVFDKWLRDNFTSCDGFMSFTPNTYRDLHREIMEGGEEFDQAVAALIQYLSNQKMDRIEYIESTIHEDWRDNEYYGLDYSINEE